MPPSSPRSRRRWSRSWRRSARCRPCSQSVSQSPPGGSRAPIALSPIVSSIKPSCSRSAAPQTAGSGSPCWAGTATARALRDIAAHRSAAMAEFWRALRTLKALQAEQALENGPRWRRTRSGPRRGHGSPIARNRTNPSASAEPAGIPHARAARSDALHEPAAPWLPTNPSLLGIARRPPVPCSPQQTASPPCSNEPDGLGEP